MKMCHGCPFNYGNKATEMAYNYGCLPSQGEVIEQCESAGKAWACHSNSQKVCAGFAIEAPDKIDLPLLLVEGVHL